jgi:hypothetical protein
LILTTSNRWVGDKQKPKSSILADYDFPDIGDMTRLSTYGEVIRDGKPKIVLVDFGLTNTVFDDFYRVKL